MTPGDQLWAGPLEDLLGTTERGILSWAARHLVNLRDLHAALMLRQKRPYVRASHWGVHSRIAYEILEDRADTAHKVIARYRIASCRDPHLRSLLAHKAEERRRAHDETIEAARQEKIAGINALRSFYGLPFYTQAS